MTEAKKGKVKIVDAVSNLKELEQSAKNQLLDMEGVGDEGVGEVEQILELIETLKQSVTTRFDDLKENVKRKFVEVQHKALDGTPR